MVSGLTAANTREAAEGLAVSPLATNRGPFVDIPSITRMLCPKLACMKMILPIQRSARLLSLLVFSFLACSPSSVTATVLSFDDLPSPGDETTAVPDGYGGINWSAGNWAYYDDEQSPYTAHSGSSRHFPTISTTDFSSVDRVLSSKAPGFPAEAITMMVLNE